MHAQLTLLRVRNRMELALRWLQGRMGSEAAPLLTLDLNREIEQLRSEGRWQSGHRSEVRANTRRQAEPPAVVS
jgi:hypothetical protein